MRAAFADWRFRLGVTVLVGGLLAVLVVSQSERSRSERELYGSLARTNQWIASQLQLEHLRFLAAVDAFVLGAPDVDHADVRHRFDLLLSRIPVFLTGPEARAARSVDGAVETVMRLDRDLAAVEPLVAGLERGATEARGAIHDRLDGYGDALHLLTLEISVGDRRVRMLSRLQRLERRDMLVQVGVVCAGLLLVVVAMHEIARSQRREEAERAARAAEQEASRAKTRFLANMSHELRTPLNAIIGFADMMQAEVLGPLGREAYRGYARDIVVSGRHLLSILNDVLDVARVEAGTVGLNEVWFDPGDAVHAAIRMLGQTAEAKRIALSAGAGPAPPALYGDPRLFRQIVLNLVGNGVKFTQAGGRVEVRCGPDGGDLLLVVEDDGPGIPAEEIENVVKPFHQCDSDLNRRHDGSGLGLSLAKGFVGLHGGSLTIDSTVGVGTRVAARFPAARLGDRSKALAA